MDKPNEVVIQMVKEYVSNDLFEIFERYGYIPQQLSYAKWSAQEILNRLYKFKNVPPLIVLEQFRDDTIKFRSVSDNLDSVLMFSTASQLADYFIDLLV